jgi:colicin import membrane protein
MNKDDYQYKIEEHRKPIELNGEEKINTNTRKSRRTTAPASKKPKQKRNYLLPILFFFFILIPVSFLIYVFAFYQPNANETTIFDNSQVQYEQNEKKDETAIEPEEETTDSTVVEEVPDETEVNEETPVTEEQPGAEQPIEEQPVEELPDEQTADANTHVVKPGETLYRIAMNYYNTPDAVERIKAANGLTSNSISTGQTLVLP